MLLLNILFVVLVSPPQTRARSDHRYEVFSAIPHTPDELSDLVQYLRDEATQGHIDIWTLPRNVNKKAEFKVTEEYRTITEAWLEKNQIDYRIVTSDIERLILNEETSEAKTRIITKSKIETAFLNLETYNDHYDMNKYLKQVAQTCDICGLIKIGMSYENRDMIVIKIGRWAAGKRAIWIDAGIHAREWIAPAVALNIVNKLVTSYHANESDVTWILDHFVFYILPSANPDGYMYSRDYDRLWRKTRKPTRRFGCLGSDPNRNWNFHWAESGVSFSRCSEIFPGEYPFSEEETWNIGKFLWRHRKRIVVYLSLHSYGQYWLYPWGYDDTLPDDWKELDRVGKSAIQKILETSGTAYDLGSSTHLLYAAAGASDDWAKGVTGIKYSYTVELPDTGDYGFFLPAEKILPTFVEFWPALVEMLYAVQEFIDDQNN